MFFNLMKEMKKIVPIERVDERHYGRTNVYYHASQTIPSDDCRMLVLSLDTPQFGENVCVHYNLGNSCYIST